MSARIPTQLFRLPGLSFGEMVVVRLLIALVVLRLWPEAVDFAGQPKPVGLALLAENWFGLELAWMSHPMAETVLTTALTALLIVYVAGASPIASTAGVTVLLSLMGALENSQGFIGHHGQVVTLVMLGQFMAHGWQRISAGKRQALRAMSPGDRCLREHRAGLFAAQQALVATYVVSAISKYNASGLGWIIDSKYFPVQILKAQKADYYSHLGDGQDEGDRITAWLEQAMTSSSLATQVLVGAALILEFGAVLALLGRWWGIGISVALISFHLTVSKVMNLTFRYNIWLLMILFLLPPVMHWLRFAAIGARVAAVWRRIPAKVLLFGVAASYLIVADRGWDELGYGFSRERVREAEVYPLSSFPMYSGFSDAPNLVYITDGEGEPVAIQKELGVMASALKKIYEARLRVISEELDVSMREMTAEQRSPAGRETLEQLRESLAPQAFQGGKFPVLRLHEMRIRRGEEGFEYQEWMVGEMRTGDGPAGREDAGGEPKTEAGH